MWAGGCRPGRREWRAPLAFAARLGHLPAMFRSASFWIFLVIGAVLAWDLVARDGAGLLFLARKGVDLLGWIAFWR